MKNETREWLRPLLVGLGSLVVVSLLVGGIVSVVALGAADVVGLGGSGDRPSSEPSLYIPTPSSTPSPQEPVSPTAAPEPETSTEPATPTPTRDRKKQSRSIRLSAGKGSVGSGQRINLSGRYPGGNGRTLQVQRYEGRWVNFPTSATVRGARFTTYVVSGRTGENRFRVVDASTGRRSNAVTVRIR